MYNCPYCGQGIVFGMIHNCIYYIPDYINPYQWFLTEDERRELARELIRKTKAEADCMEAERDLILKHKDTLE